MNENIEIKNEEERDEYFEELLGKYEDIQEKGNMGKDEWEFCENLRMYMYDEKGMDDENMAALLEVEKTTISHWRYRRNLPKIGNEELRVCSKKYDYPKTERELELVRKFVLKAILRHQSRGGNHT